MRNIRILISSPADVAEERQKARQIVEQLQKRYAGQLQLAPVLWEDLPLGLDDSFQAGIDLVLSAAKGIDIAVFILWSRLGSPIGGQVARTDGSAYRSGTERELDLMLAARQASGGRRPSILAYVRDDAESFQERMRGRPTDSIREMIEQKQLVEQFVREQFNDASTGTNLRAYHAYDKPLEYAHRLRTHLQALLDELVQEQPGVVRWEGPPFRGLDVFDVEHAAIFFGREREVADVLLALHARAASGCGAIVIAGASGAGKSSLVRAGVVPALVDENLDSATATWRYAIFRPGASGPNAFLGLSHALTGQTALPEIRARLERVEDLAAALSDSAESAYRLTISPSLRAFDEGALPARLLIVVDQLEELFADGGRRDVIARFFRSLRVLAETDRIRVIVTVRSDFYSQLQEYDDLLALKQGRGLYDLLPARPAALQQMIARPAALSGLRFEEDPTTGQSLDKQILDDASEHPEALPLLQYALRELFERSCTDRHLTFARYRELGGVVGALSRRVEEVFLSLSAPAQQSLGYVLNQLVTVGEEDAGAVARQRATLSALTGATPQRELVERFIEARLLVTDRSATDEAVVSVAHESLLRVWTRAAQWIEANRQFLSGRTRVQQDLDRWLREGKRDDYLIAAGKPMEDARALLTMGRERLLLEQRDYIERSIAYHLRGQQRQLRRSRIAAAVFLVLALAAAIVGAFAWAQKTRAVSAERVATEERDRARSESEKNLILNTELKEQLYDNRIAVAERELATHQDIDLASSLLELCPAELQGWEWHYLMALRDRERHPLTGHKRGLWTAAFSPDGQRIVTASIDGTVKVWDADSGQVVRTFDRHNELVLNMRGMFPGHDFPDILVKAAIYSPDGKFIASGSVSPAFTPPTLKQLVPSLDLRRSPGTVMIWDAQTGDVVRTFSGQVGVTLALTYTPDGRFIASSSINPDHTFVVWESETGHVVKVVHGHTGHVYALCYSPDGSRLLSGGIDGSIRVWDATTLGHVQTIDAHPAPVMGLAFKPGGEEFSSAGQDGTVRIWDSTSFAMRRVLRGHTGSALSVAYAPDGSRIASAGFDKTVRLWDPKTGRLKITLRRHTDTVWCVAFSPDGRRLLSASYDNTAYVWDATSPQQPDVPGVFSLLGHSERVNGVAFSPDGRLLASSSWDNTVRLWDAQTGAPRGTLAGHSGPVWGLAFSPDSRWIGSAAWDQTVRIWDVSTGRQIHSLVGHEAPAHDVAFTLDGQRVVTSGWDGAAKVWDLQTGESILNLDVSLFPVLGVDVSSDGERVACASGDRTISLWSLRTGKKLLAIENAHEAAAYDVVFSPDGSRMVSSGWDGVATVWNADPTFSGPSAGRRVIDLRGHRDRIYRVAFAPDGKHIATASDDKQVRIWDALTGKQTIPPLDHRGVVWAVAFSPDGHRVATGAWTKSAWVRTWRVD